MSLPSRLVNTKRKWKSPPLGPLTHLQPLVVWWKRRALKCWVWSWRIWTAKLGIPVGQPSFRIRCRARYVKLKRGDRGLFTIASITECSRAVTLIDLV
jgi:hypothetical protein